MDWRDISIMEGAAWMAAAASYLLYPQGGDGEAWAVQRVVQDSGRLRSAVPLSVGW